MSDLLRDASIGQIIRYFTRNRVLQYPEEKADFTCPGSYSGAKSPGSEESEDAIEIEKPAVPAERAIPEGTVLADEKVESTESPESSTSQVNGVELDKVPTVEEGDGAHLEGIHIPKTQQSQLNRVGTRAALKQSHTQADLENQVSLAIQEKGPSRPVVPETLDDGTILVDWYTTDDPENPQNWSLRKKIFVTLQIW
jgi:DHA1 family multidrug resistance protein-like MFS transporter